MSEFILLFRGGNTATQESPEKLQAHMKQWMEWMDRLQREGKFIGAQPLNETGKVIKGGKRIVTDGPFREEKEIIGGYLLCKAESYTEAIEIANGCPVLESADGIVEVREVRELKM